METEKSGSHIGAVTAGCIALIAALYFLVPVLFAIPLQSAVRHGYVSYEAYVTTFAPVAAIMDQLPPYHRLIRSEESFCRQHGLMAD